ncbi:MAG TPA: hypothetical protein VGH19_00310 [Verrucomicrobiae bacterium]
MTRILKFIGKWALRAFIVLVILVIALILLKDRIFQAVVQSRLEKQTGLKVELKSAEFNLRTGMMRFEGLKIFNPTEYGDSSFIHFDDLRVEADRVELKQRKLHFRLLHINMSELTIVEDKQGKLNLQAIKEQLDKKKKESKKPGKPGDDGDDDVSAMEFGGIDTLHLTLGKVKKISLNYPDKPVDTDLGVKDVVIKDVRTQEDFQNKVLPVLLRGGVAVIYQIWMDSKYRQSNPALVPATP